MAVQILSEEQISVFCRSLAMMLRSGVTMQEAVELFVQDGDDASPLLHSTAQQMEKALGEGQSFAQTARDTGAFPEYALGVFSMAELSGRLDEVLDRLADYYDRQHALNERLRSTLTYPVALLLMMCGVLSVLVFSVLPMFVRVYNSLTGSLAASSYAYVLAASLIGRVSLVLAVAVSAVLLVLAVMLHTQKGREKLNGPMERSRFTRKAARQLAVSQMADTVSTMLASGAEEDSALEQCIRQTSHTGLRTALQACRSDMQQGTGMAQAFLRHKVLPPLYARMLQGGSESGSLPAAMESVALRMGQEAENALCRLIDDIEPVLIGFLTVSVGFTLLSVMLPLLGILSAV
ncbi:MAG: type II secretion system F family protein [Subdoligranulum sp.]|nr:type II secretion system F family protein [Subdoligranulum sp.]MDY5922872.1 type II secretion system F family protein [Oscillospiraceae bacterium]